MTTATHDIDDSVSHIRQLLDTAKATQRPSDARLVDEALRMLEAEEILAVSERRVQIGYRLKGGVSHDALAKLRVWVDEAKRTQRSTDIDMVRGALTVIEAEETLAKIVERAERRRQTASLPPGYDYASAAHDMFAAPPPGHEWTDDSKTEVREVHRHGTGPARPLDHAWSVYMGCEDPPGFCSRDALDAGEVNSIVVARNNAWAKFRATQNCDFFFKAPDGRVYGPYVNKASMHGDAWVHATDPDLFIAPTPGADEILTPEEYEAALACEVSDTEIYNAVDQAMREALASRAPFFRVSVPSSALERAKAMLVKWDVQESPKPTMREGAVYLAHLKVSPRVPAFEVFLVGDVVVVAEDADNARLLTSSMTSDPRMRQLLLEGFESVEPRQVDSSEVLEVYLWDGHGGAPVTHSAGEWAKTQGRGVLGLIMGSALEKKFRAREHREECNGVPCYCEDAKRQADGEYFDAARENHLYFIGPNLYVAESEEAALKYHHVGVIDNTAKLEDLRQSILEEAPSEVEMASRHVDAVFAEVSKVYAIRRVAEDEMLPEIVELSEFKEAVQVSDKTYNDWRSGKMGSVGLLRSYYQEVITPHVEAIMAAAAVAGERRLQEVREKLGIGDGLTVTREDNGGS